MLSQPSKAQATPLPAFSESCEMENREQQNRFLQPIQDSDRQGDRNPRVFLKAKVIPASSQLNPDRDKIFNFSGQQSSNLKFGPANSAQQFRYGAQNYLTPDLNFSQNCFGDKCSILNSPIATTIDHRGAHTISANSFSLRHILTNRWSAHLKNNSSVILISPLTNYGRLLLRISESLSC